jgi:hypothetical protein
MDMLHAKEGKKWHTKLCNLKGRDNMGDLDLNGLVLQKVLGRTGRLLSLTRHGPH